MSKITEKTLMNHTLELISRIVETTDTASIIAAAETTVKTSLHCEDVIDEFDPAEAETLGATFVVERMLGQICRDLHFGLAYGESALRKAQRQLAGFLAKLKSSKGDPEFERQVIGRVRWLVQMATQQEFRKSLFETFAALYKSQTGLDWVAPEDVKSEGEIDDNDAVKALMAL